ncbi:alanine--tRNA ligase [Candidatus Rariloculus sp.]|uniref:alanine--tRNA ligase n=1 Tax=Candidatus Rariloculus sp. TaxID=3101265 RepID=UPI003D13492E
MTHSSSELRKAFLDFFAERGHEIVPSSPLVPANDPTLLFTNAGMVQFKDVFLGRESRDTQRAVTSQRCVRAGGKHNDLENVGYTARHHTFFEMLGNFSFGDYFKREAIHYAWEFMTGVLGLPPERLWCTVYLDDDEAASIWLDEIGIDKRRFGRMGEDENFWSMGDTGPCGPCAEIFYDHGDGVPGGPPGSPDAEGDRYVEIWNLVFMQYDRNAQGELAPLPKPSVDTGLGLERLAAVMQGVHSNYEIDLFRNLIESAAAVTRTSDLESKSLRVIADHIRACSFLIADGVLPGNEGRGYVLRRIIRRALRHGYKLGIEDPFFHSLVASVEAEMGQAYPELSAQRSHVERVLLQEEQRFAETLTKGMRLLEGVIADLPRGGALPGETVFRLYDTYGFPEDLTADIARERGLAVDGEGFERAMKGQRTRSRRASRFEAIAHDLPSLSEETEFLGYECLEAEGEIVALFDAEANPVERLTAGNTGIVVLDRTPFYAESGGQVGDTGRLLSEAGRFADDAERLAGYTGRLSGAPHHLFGAAAEFRVSDTRKLDAAHGHIGSLASGELAVGASVSASVDAERRAAIVLNHSATHLLHAALRQVLGSHVQQKGSLVAPDRLRFDFSHYDPVGSDGLEQIEALVNEQVRLNSEAATSVVSYDEAIAGGALAFFGDKYGDDVRVLTLGDFSTELCGGTHVSRAGDIGLFKITSESGIAAGQRRIEAVTGRDALTWVNAGETVLRDVAGLLKGRRVDVRDKVAQLIERARHLEREVENLKSKLATGGGRDLLDETEVVNGIELLVARLDSADFKALRGAADQLKDRLGSGVVVLGSVEAGKVCLVAGVTKDLTGRLNAGKLIKPIAECVGGSGGGRPDFAQAGGNLPDKLDEALALVRTVL